MSKITNDGLTRM